MRGRNKVDVSHHDEDSDSDPVKGVFMRSHFVENCSGWTHLSAVSPGEFAEGGGANQRCKPGHQWKQVDAPQVLLTLAPPLDRGGSDAGAIETLQ